MPVAHLGLTVSHIPSATDFYLSVLQPLGYRYHGTRGDSIGLGHHDADFFLTQEPGGRVYLARSSHTTDEYRYRIAPTHIAFSAKDRTAVRDCYAAALNAGGRPSGPPSYRQDDCKCFNAAVEDLDGNTVEFIWRDDVNKHDRTRSITDYRDVEAYSTPRLGIRRAQTDPVDNGTSKSLFGAVIGAAAGAAALAMFTSSRDSERKEDRYGSRERSRDVSAQRRGSLPAPHKSEYKPAPFVNKIEARPYRDEDKVSYTRQTLTQQSEGRTRGIQRIEYGPSRYIVRRSTTLPVDNHRSSLHHTDPKDRARGHSGRRGSAQLQGDQVSRHTSGRNSVQHSGPDDQTARRDRGNNELLSSRRDSVVSGSTSKSYRSAKEHRSSTSRASTVKPIKKDMAHYAPVTTPTRPSLAAGAGARVKKQPKGFDAYYLPGNADEESDGLDDTATIVPDDSISCINLPTTQKRRSRSRRNSTPRNGSMMTIPMRSSRAGDSRTRNAHSNA